MDCPRDKIIQGDALAVLKDLESESVDCCITSPPYWALRDYKTEGQLGMERTFNEYLDNLIRIFGQVKRALKKEGSIWVDIGDTFASAGGNKQKPNKLFPQERIDSQQSALKLKKNAIGPVPEKSLVGIPERFAIRMTDELGLIRRNTIIWHKPNAMPSSVRDRFMVDFEYVYFFVKSPRYYFETQYQPLQGSTITRTEGAVVKFGGIKYPGIVANGIYSGNPYIPSPLGSRKRCVWKISTKAFKGAHFATFPPDLIAPMIKAGCPVNGVVLDPFMGAGTTGLVAKQLGRSYLGIELNADYVQMAEARLC